MFSKKDFGIVSNLRFISMKKFYAQLSWAWKKFYNPVYFVSLQFLSSFVFYCDVSLFR